MKEWQKQKILDLYIHDYLVRKKMKTTAGVLALEADIQVKPVALDEGFQEYFWCIFCDVYVSRLNKNPQSTTPETPAPSDLSAVSNLTGTQCPVMESLLQEEKMIPNQFEQSISEEEMMRYLAAEMSAESSDGSRAQNGVRKARSNCSTTPTLLHDSVVQPNVVDLTLPEPVSDYRVMESLCKKEQILRHLGFSQDEISELTHQDSLPSTQAEMDMESLMMMRPSMEFTTCQYGQTSGGIESQHQID